MEKGNQGGAKGGDNPPDPGAALTREQVMAQRAEAKKLKAARKGKSAGAPEGGGMDKKASSVQKPKQLVSVNPKSEQKPVKTQMQSSKAEPPKLSKDPKPEKKEPSPIKIVTVEVGTLTLEESQPSKKSGENGAASTTLEVPSTENSKSLETTPTKGKTSDRSGFGSKCPTEFPSKIRSLFYVKKTKLELEYGKDKKFQFHHLFDSLGVKLINNVIRGANKRCVALLHTIQDYTRDYRTPSRMSFKHGFSNDFKMQVDILRERCPFAIGMNNAVEYLHAFLCKMEPGVGTVNQQKEEIIDVIDQYIEEKIEKAVEAIVLYGVEKICTGDVIMIYSITEAVLTLLEKAVEEMEKNGKPKKFDLILVQTPETMLDIRILLEKLNVPIKKELINISCINFSNAIDRMKHCTKLLIGGHGLFNTGGVMAQTGSGELALLASIFNKPALFLCETYKFCDRSPLDCFTLDEYVSEKSITEDGLFEPKIKYDVTPASLVTVVITDVDMLPSTSVPVVLRVQEGRTPRKQED